jgi:hypothetical protein
MNWVECHRPSWTGGVARSAGVVVQKLCSSLNNHPVCADSGCFAMFFLLHSHPSCPGGVILLLSLIDRAFKKND